MRYLLPLVLGLVLGTAAQADVSPEALVEANAWLARMRTEYPSLRPENINPSDADLQEQGYRGKPARSVDPTCLRGALNDLDADWSSAELICEDAP